MSVIKDANSAWKLKLTVTSGKTDVGTVTSLEKGIKATTAASETHHKFALLSLCFTI